MTSRTRIAAFGTAGLLFLPSCLYAGAVAYSVASEAALDVGAFDLGLLVLVAGYTLAAVLALRTRRPIVVARFLVCTYSTLLTLALGEAVAARLYPRDPGGLPWPPMRQVRAVSPHLIGVSGPVTFTVNALGVRGPDADLSARSPRVLCVGGSTTECLYVSDERSWPWLLQEELTRQLGRPAYVGNAGKSGHLTVHHEYLLRHYRHAARFDRVLILCGWNDLRALVERRNYEERLRQVPEETLTPTPHGRAIYHRLATVRLLRQLAGRLKPFHQVVQDPAGQWILEERAGRQELLHRHPIRQLPSGLDASLAVYRRNIEAIIAACRDAGQRPLFLTQPTLYRKDLPPELEALLTIRTEDSAYTVDVLTDLMDAFNRCLVETCRAEGADYFDLAAVLPKETTVFYDDVHFNDSGCAKVAAAVGAHLAERIRAERLSSVN